jgi:hypothetical protein
MIGAILPLPLYAFMVCTGYNFAFGSGVCCCRVLSLSLFIFVKYHFPLWRCFSYLFLVCVFVCMLSFLVMLSIVFYKCTILHVDFGFYLDCCCHMLYCCCREFEFKLVIKDLQMNCWNTCCVWSGDLLYRLPWCSLTCAVSVVTHVMYVCWPWVISWSLCSSFTVCMTSMLALSGSFGWGDNG